MSEIADKAKHSFISSYSFLLAENNPSQSKTIKISEPSSYLYTSTTDIQIPSVQREAATLNLVPKNLFIT